MHAPLRKVAPMEGIWSDDLSTGIERLDNEHKELFQHISALRAATRAGNAREALHNTLRFLEGYVKEHFDAEVEYMRRFEYPGILQHEAEHDQFIASLAEFKKELAELDSRGEITSFLGIEIERKLTAWLADHVGSTDRKMADFLAGKM